MRAERKSLLAGSPPPMRGKVSPVLVRAIPDRITPAYAGKSTPLYQLSFSAMDHPRLCGEKRRFHCNFQRRLGSPPPMRGKVCTVRCGFLGMGITPAYAGKRFRGQRGSKIYKDHPRLCGEKFTFLIDTVFPARITPAYAGKRLFVKLLEINSQDHPRLCGEKHNSRINRTGHVGSPPPMRGKACFFQLGEVPAGITPAYAGKSLTDPQPVFSNQDHPRLCGEKSTIHHVLNKEIGSPPPMRGKGHTAMCTLVLHRITPAYAGKSGLICKEFQKFWDHPRLCGEKFPPPKSSASAWGSPPPMRGKDEKITLEGMTSRITPAYAGKRSAVSCKAAS